jgi:hypothetical protein
MLCILISDNISSQMYNSCYRNILKEANWEIVGQTQDDEAVVYAYDRGYESSSHESEDLYYDGNEERVVGLQISDDVEEMWDLLPPVSSDECGSWTASFLVEDMNNVQLGSSSCGITEHQYDMQSPRDGVLELQNVIVSSSDSCKSREDETHTSSETVEFNGCVVRYESVESIPVRDNLSIKNAQGNMQLTSQHSRGFSTKLNSEDDNFQLLTDLEPDLVERTFAPFVGHTTSEEGFQFTEMDEMCVTPHVDLSQVLDCEKCSNTEALMHHKSDTHKTVGTFLSLCSYSDDCEVNGEHMNAKHLEHLVTDRHLNTSNINLSSDSFNAKRSTEKLSNVSQSSCTEELHLHLMQEITDGCVSKTVASQPLNFGSASSSVQESSQDRSLVESCSFDEQNEKAGDSGYPNSFSVQDMDMDLTPEQVDELTTESDEIITEDSEYYDSESSEESDRIDDNEGVFRFNHEVLYDPVGLVVENGDVANNNRDREGNNAVAVIHAPHQPHEADDPPDEAFIPLLAAAEDFDNDNDIILPDDGEAFPHWLLQLLDLAHHGVGDVQNYVIPLGGGGGAFLMPVVGMGDIDSEDDDCIGNVAASSSSNEMGDNEGALNNLDSEFLVPVCSGEGAEPDMSECGV